MTAVKIFKIVVSFFAVLFIAAFLIFSVFYLKSNIPGDSVFNKNFNIATSSMPFLPPEISKIGTSSYSSEPVKTVKQAKELQINPKTVAEKPTIIEPIREVSSKSFEELVNSSVIQLYCGYLDGEEMLFSSISRGTGIIINSRGEILTNRHIIYDENLQKIKSNCFVLKSPFPNVRSEKPKIYYVAQIINYPLEEKFSNSFSRDRYYNDFAILKIAYRPTSEIKINQLLQIDYASEADYLILENNDVFNYFPIDWNYHPKNDDLLITLGYGVDASHIANQITSTIGRLTGNIDIRGDSKPQILLIESNATAGFSGGALINPQSKGLIGLISWITSGDVTGKYTVAIFRDFLAETMLQDLNFDLK
ncbi:MAG: trypsin-like peptidase domain-containing protein [Candidatus Azambacteria bacterium]|nr:trypsin-like peptidase domain-containing protein [Candidatus Azambacteria bacterium]